MPDELDPQLLRWFAESHEPLEDAGFSRQLASQLGSRPRLLPPGAGGILAAMRFGLVTGIRAPLRQARLLALCAAAATLWVAAQIP